MLNQLSDLILSLTPEDGSSIGNGSMLALLRERMPELTDQYYQDARNRLIEADRLGRGRGRGGPIFRIIECEATTNDDGRAPNPAPASTPGQAEGQAEGQAPETDPTPASQQDQTSDEFDLTLIEAPTPKPRKTTTGAKPAKRKPDAPTQVLSYRHGATGQMRT